MWQRSLTHTPFQTKVSDPFMKTCFFNWLWKLLFITLNWCLLVIELWKLGPLTTLYRSIQSLLNLLVLHSTTLSTKCFLASKLLHPWQDPNKCPLIPLPGQYILPFICWPEIYAVPTCNLLWLQLDLRGTISLLCNWMVSSLWLHKRRYSLKLKKEF